MNKYGIDNFYIELLEVCNINVIDDREIYYISLYDSTNKSKGYNVSIGGNTPKFKRPTFNIKSLIELYVNEQLTLEEIAQKFNTTRYIICTELRNAGVIIRKRSDSSSKFNKIPVEVLLKALEENDYSLRKAAKQTNIKYSTFRNACIYHNIEYNFPKSIRH